MSFLIEAKKRAADERTTMRAIFERALRRELSSRAAHGSRKKPRIHWVVVDGGLPPGLDIASREKMADHPLR